MATISETLALAIQHQKAGRLDPAEQIYRQILVVEPNQPDALLHLGALACEVLEHTHGIEYIRRALALKPDWDDARTALANAEKDMDLWRGVLVKGTPPMDRLTLDSVGTAPPAGSLHREQATKQYCISLVAPKGWVHFHAYREITLLLKQSLESLGLGCDVRLNELAKDRINILLGYHTLTDPFDLLALKEYQYIPYQLEQLGENARYYLESSRVVLANAVDVWDYARENVAFLKGVGIQAKYLPIGYHEKLEVIDCRRDKDVDVLFYGVLSERRREFFRKMLRTTGLKLKVLIRVFGPERDEWIARSRIILNIHQFHQFRVLESPRVAYLLNNRCFLLCENASNDPYPTVGLQFGTMDELIDKCLAFIASPDRAEEVAQQWHERFKAGYNMVDLLRAVL